MTNKESNAENLIVPVNLKDKDIEYINITCYKPIKETYNVSLLANDEEAGEYDFLFTTGETGLKDFFYQVLIEANNPLDIRVKVSSNDVEPIKTSITEYAPFIGKFKEFVEYVNNKSDKPVPGDKLVIDNKYIEYMKITKEDDSFEDELYTVTMEIEEDLACERLVFLTYSTPILKSFLKGYLTSIKEKTTNEEGIELHLDFEGREHYTTLDDYLEYFDNFPALVEKIKETERMLDEE